MSLSDIRLRPATPDDAVAISALAIQVFLDTYAIDGIDRDVAREAFCEYSLEAFATRVRQPDRCIVVAERSSGLVGFVEVQRALLPAPAGGRAGAEIVRLYIQPAWQRQGVGRHLLQAAERIALNDGREHLWLTAWDANHRALRFYAAHGYQDVGATTYAFQGRAVGNRVLAKCLCPGRLAA